MTLPSRNIMLSLTAGLALSGLAMYFAFRNVPFAELRGYLGAINYWWMAPSALLVVLAFAVRAWRWQVILQPAAKIGYWQAFHPLMIGFMLNCVMPGRVGELARPLLLQRWQGCPFSTGLATVVVERVFDFAFLVCSLGLILLMMDIDATLQVPFGAAELSRDTLVGLGWKLLAGALLVLAGMALLCWPPARARIKQAIRGLPGFIPQRLPRLKTGMHHRICEPLALFTENFARGLALVTNLRQLSLCVVLTMVIWGLGGLSYYTMMLGAPGLALSYLEISVVMIIVSFFIALPSVPGFWGIWEAGGIFALMLFGIAVSEAAGYTLTNHVVQIFPVIIVGLMSALYTGVNIIQVARRPAAGRPRA